MIIAIEVDVFIYLRVQIKNDNIQLRFYMYCFLWSTLDHGFSIYETLHYYIRFQLIALYFYSAVFIVFLYLCIYTNQRCIQIYTHFTLLLFGPLVYANKNTCALTFRSDFPFCAEEVCTHKSIF